MTSPNISTERLTQISVDLSSSENPPATVKESRAMACELLGHTYSSLPRRPQPQGCDMSAVIEELRRLGVLSHKYETTEE